MVITERLMNPIYNRINEWMIEHKCVNINVFELDEKEAFFWAMQIYYPGVSKELTDDFWRTAKQLMR